MADLLTLGDCLSQIWILAGRYIAAFARVLVLLVGDVLHHQLVFLQLFLEVLDYLVGLFKFWGGIELVYLVDVDCSLDVLRFLAKVQGVYRLLIVAQCLSNRANNRSLRVATKSWLQNSSHFWVTIVDKLLPALALTKLVDDVRQG